MPGQVQEGQEEPLKRMAKIVTSMMARPDSGPFLEPVDWRGMELWDYPTVVKKMMDLGTIKRKLERNQYETTAQCAADIRLVWKNCMLYNADKSDFWLLAKTLSKRFEDRYRKVKAEFYVGEEIEEEEEEEDEEEDSDEDDEEEFEGAGDEEASGTKSRSSVGSSGGGGGIPTMTLDAKARLASNILLLSGPELGHVISTIQLKSSKACLQLSTGVLDKMELLLDELEPQIFEQISKYAAEKASIRKRGLSASAASALSLTGSAAGNSSNNNAASNSDAAAVSNSGDDASNKRKRKK